MASTVIEQPKDEWSFQYSDVGDYVFKFKVKTPEKNWTVKVLKSIKIGHINLGRGWGWDCSILGIYYYLIKLIYILITWLV